MEKQDDGGPAFPRPAVEYDSFRYDAVPGMTLLDWFAGQALAGFIVETAINAARGSGFPEPEDVARYVYTYAAAMLAEKRRRSSPSPAAQGEGQS